MKVIQSTDQSFVSSSTETEFYSLNLDPNNVQNEVLKRLIQEVEVEKLENKLNAYNRTHNRHNRGR